MQDKLQITNIVYCMQPLHKGSNHLFNLFVSWELSINRVRTYVDHGDQFNV